jgi:hypothetical protein
MRAKKIILQIQRLIEYYQSSIVASGEQPVWSLDIIFAKTLLICFIQLYYIGQFETVFRVRGRWEGPGNALQIIVSCYYYDRGCCLTYWIYAYCPEDTYKDHHNSEIGGGLHLLPANNFKCCKSEYKNIIPCFGSKESISAMKNIMLCLTMRR